VSADTSEGNDHIGVLLSGETANRCTARSGLIFETLDDRSADLKTADLLNNYLFSQAGDTDRLYQIDVDNDCSRVR
jgi:uncharacterized protein with ParB-like and HNH nuclease domain